MRRLLGLVSGLLLTIALAGCPAGSGSAVTPPSGDADDTSGTCAAEVVDATAGVRYSGYVSLALDATGAPHIAYADVHDNILKYASRSGSSWSAVTVDAEAGAGNGVSMRIGSDGVARMSYLYSDGVNLEIRSASGSGSTWSVESIGAGRESALALDAADHPHVFYRDTSAVRYASNLTGAWDVELVASTTATGAGVGLALDSDGHAHACYRDADGLHYATNLSGSWTVSPLGTPGASNGVGCSIQAPAAGRVDILFGDMAVASLQHASSTNGVWSFETVDSTLQGASSESALGVDGDGALHAVYYDSAAHNLHYATNASGAWAAQVLDSSADVGWDCALALDLAKQQMHVAYVNRTRAAVDYLLCDR